MATACFSWWIAILSIPMLSGRFVAGPYNDQYSSGYAYRAWAAEWWKRLGHVPLWNPEIFGGMPFVGGMHGDVLYPTAWLRLVLPTHVAMNLGFAVHYVLAGLFVYLFLRRWRVSWAGSVVGRIAYQLAGVVGSYVSPGHDGKLFATTMLPLALLGLTLGIRDRRLDGYAILALAVGLIMLSPHPQMAQYALLAAGLFTLYLVFADGSVTGASARVKALALAMLGVIVGVGVSAIQYMPFYAYIPYSPRDGSVLHDFAWSAAFAIPWSHVPELVIPRFTGESLTRSYWGPNGLKLHSEYLGLLVVALACVGAVGAVRRPVILSEAPALRSASDVGKDPQHPDRRNMIFWLGGIGLLFLLVALGSATPFFRLWWEVVPFAKSMRAPGMALFIVAFVTSVLAAFGVDRITSGASKRFAGVAVGVGLAFTIIGVSGGFGAIAESLGQAVELHGLPQRASMALTAADNLQWSALFAGLVLTAAGVLAVLVSRGRLRQRALSIGLIALVGLDLWLNDRVFWIYSDVRHELFGSDAIKARLASLPKPMRVWDVTGQGVDAVYPGAALMADDIAQLYGHHGNEPHTFDVLNERIGSSLTFARAGDPQILDLFAVNYLILPAPIAPDSLPGFRRTLHDVASSSGVQATLFEREQPIGYARFIPAAAAPSSLQQTVATVVDPQFEIDRVVLVDSAAGLTPGTIPNPLPAASDITVSFTDWKPGEMHMRLSAAPPAAGYVLVSENWDSEWRATVDGRDARVLRGDATLITVPVPAGAREIIVRYEGRAYARGTVITLIALLIVVLGLIAPRVLGHLYPRSPTT